MAQPIPIPDSIPYYMLLKQVMGKFVVYHNPDPNSTGFFHRLEDAQNQQLMETLRDPTSKYQVYPIDWPT